MDRSQLWLRGKRRAGISAPRNEEKTEEEKKMARKTGISICRGKLAFENSGTEFEGASDRCLQENCNACGKKSNKKRRHQW